MRATSSRGAKRLGEVVVGAELEPEHAVDLLAAGREHQHRHGGSVAQLLADGEAVAAWQHDVEQDDVVLAGQRPLEPELAVGGDLDDEVVALQVLGRALGEPGVVFDQQDTERLHGLSGLRHLGAQIKRDHPVAGGIRRLGGGPGAPRVDRRASASYAMGMEFHCSRCHERFAGPEGGAPEHCPKCKAEAGLEPVKRTPLPMMLFAAFLATRGRGDRGRWDRVDGVGLKHRVHGSFSAVLASCAPAGLALRWPARLAPASAFGAVLGPPALVGVRPGVYRGPLAGVWTPVRPPSQTFSCAALPGFGRVCVMVRGAS
jgi:hypothetical protein